MEVPTFEEHFKRLKSNLWLMGMPYGDFKLHLRYFVLYIWLWFMIVEEGAFLISKVGSVNLLEITQLTPCWCIGLLSALKITALTLKRRKFFYLIESLSRRYEVILKDLSKRDLIRSKTWLVTFLNKYFFVLNIVLVSVYNFSSPLLILYRYLKSNEVVFVMPYAVLLPFEVDGWLIWAGVYFHSIMSGYICIIYFTTTDILYCVLTTHICANFAVISSNIEKLEPKDVKSLTQIIKDHQYILKLSNDLEDIFTAPNLFNVLVGSIEICALGFNLTMGDFAQIPGCILFLFSVLLQILMMSVFGENIITESTRIGHAAYHSKWYEMDKKAKRILLILITRCHRPQRLTAYKFSVISYGSFSKIISTSWSYFTILRTVYTPPDANRN